MTPQRDWLWDRKISIKKARAILKNPKDVRFLSLAALLLSRKNTPKEVFRFYIKQIDFLWNWNAIKRQMRKDRWNDPRIEFWQAIYEAVKEKHEKEGKLIKKEKPPIVKLENEFYKTIADKIKIARKQKDLSQSALARKLGVSQQFISRIEKGKENISLGTLKKILDAIGAQPYFEVYAK